MLCWLLLKYIYNFCDKMTNLIRKALVGNSIEWLWIEFYQFYRLLPILHQTEVRILKWASTISRSRNSRNFSYVWASCQQLGNMSHFCHFFSRMSLQSPTFSTRVKNPPTPHGVQERYLEIFAKPHYGFFSTSSYTWKE